jgi:hypothetical protein
MQKKPEVLGKGDSGGAGARKRARNECRGNLNFFFIKTPHFILASNLFPAARIMSRD